MRLFLPLILLTLSITGCIPLVVGSSGAAGYVGAQERSPGKAVDDTIIWSKIKNLYTQKDVNNLLTRVSVEVTEGRVLLTGNVDTPENRLEAVRLAWQPEGVKEVINEIQISNATSFQSYAQDKWISTAVRSRLILNKDVHLVNYSIDTVNQVVYLMGIAQTADEIETATNIASTVNGVKKVVSHLRLRDNPKRNEK